MKKLTRARVVPIMSASVSWLTLVMMGSGLPSLPKFASSRRARAKTLFARVEQLIDQIRFDANCTGEEMRDEEFGKSRLFVQHARERYLFDPHDLAFYHGGCRCHAHRLAGQASFAAELVLPKHGNDGFFASFGDDRELYPALLNVKHRIGTISLREDPLIFEVFRNRAARAHDGQERLRIEG